MSTNTLEKSIFMFFSEKFVSKRLRVPYVILGEKLRTIRRNNGVLNKEKATFLTLDASNYFGKKVRNVLLKSLGECQPLTTRKGIKETPKKVNGWFTPIRFVHDDKCSKFGAAEWVKSRNMNLKILEYITKELNKRHPKIGVNLEAYVDDMVIKSQTYQDIIRDVEQTFSTLQKINMKLNLKKCLFEMEEGKSLGYVVTSERIRVNPEKTKAIMDIPSPRTLKQMQSLKATEATFLEIKKLVFELPTLTTPKKGETLMMYLAVADEAFSAVLLTERDGRQIAIHYVSRSLQGAKTNYAPMDKLTLGLVHAARLAKWDVELGWYGIQYFPRVAVEGQVLADFLADTSTEVNATLVVANTLRVEDIPESSNARENLTPVLRA
ncbi:reverse transcriptase domain-containing protein [Tanacetum coccineum]